MYKMGVEVPTTDMYRGLNLTELKLDQAYVNISEHFENGKNGNTHYLYLRSENCYGCPFKRFGIQEKVKKYFYHK